MKRFSAVAVGDLVAKKVAKKVAGKIPSNNPAHAGFTVQVIA
ncbi:hypothetical protein [Pseudomonas sp. MWU13-2517]|jgi:hypothetical protein|nr:hypothetical protein [Pseudomonas sp. MWU13-2517]